VPDSAAPPATARVPKARKSTAAPRDALAKPAAVPGSAAVKKPPKAPSAPRARKRADATVKPRAAPAVVTAPEATLVQDERPSVIAAPVPVAYVDVSDHDRRLVVWALGISIALHAVVLAIRFQPFDLSNMFDRGPMLEVALVNAKSLTKPTKADILAQAHLDGGGNTDADRRAKTPLPVMPKDESGDDVSVATQQTVALERQTQELLTQLRSSRMPAAVPKPVDAPPTDDAPTAAEMAQRTMEVMRLEAQIAKDMDAYQKRPKRRFIGARAEEYRFARYVEDWRMKVERIGNLNYPEAAREQKLYGGLLLTVSIRADGSIESIEVNQSSGHRVLDAAAVKIVEMAAPYAPFPPDIKRDTDVLSITRTWTFTKGDELQSQGSSR
jgi:periplasmic protein TonB